MSCGCGSTTHTRSNCSGGNDVAIVNKAWVHGVDRGAYDSTATYVTGDIVHAPNGKKYAYICTEAPRLPWTNGPITHPGNVVIRGHEIPLGWESVGSPMYYLIQPVHNFPGTDPGRYTPPYTAMVPAHTVTVYDTRADFDQASHEFLTAYPFGIARDTARIWYYNYTVRAWAELGELYGSTDVEHHSAGTLDHLPDTVDIVASASDLPTDPLIGSRYLIEDVWEVFAKTS